MAFGGCVGVVGGWGAGRPDLSGYPLGVFWGLIAARPIERNFIPHSTTLARGRMSGNRLGAGLGVRLGRFRFWGERLRGLRRVRKVGTLGAPDGATGGWMVLGRWVLGGGGSRMRQVGDLPHGGAGAKGS